MNPGAMKTAAMKIVPKKIGIVVESLDGRRGGAEQWTSQYVAALATLGHEVHVLARDFDSTLAKPPYVAHKIESNGRSKLAFAEAVERALGSLKLEITHDMGYGWSCDVFQPHGGARKAAAAANLELAPAWRRPIERRLANWLPRYREFERLGERQYASRDRLYVAISRRVAHEMVERQDAPPDRVRLVYNGVDPRRFSPDHRSIHREKTRKLLGIAPGETLVLIVAHNFRLKGVSTLIEAVGRLVREGAPLKLAVAGGKKSPRAYERLARLSGAENHVRFLGSVADPVPLYAAADVYAQPTHYDPCSLVVLEALASGLPVITSSRNGAGELLTEGVDGYVVDEPTDVKRLAERLRVLLDPTRRLAMSQAARSKALDWTFERNVQGLLAVYDEIASEKTRSPRGILLDAPPKTRASRVA